ncbi:MAG: hypothetical protein R3B91_14375 [Planctomycetaceae bacterium]
MNSRQGVCLPTYLDGDFLTSGKNNRHLFDEGDFSSLDGVSVSAMKRLFRPPGLVRWPVVLVGLWLWLSGRFVPMPVNDTPSYREFPWHSVHDALTHIRTPGYPAFLAAVAPGKNSPPFRSLTIWSTA